MRSRLQSVGLRLHAFLQGKHLAGKVQRAADQDAHGAAFGFLQGADGALHVGSRRGGLRSSMHEVLGGSVAAHLSHRQPRPVVVIPLPGPESSRI